MLLSLLIGWFLEFYFYFSYMYMQVCAYLSGDTSGVQKDSPLGHIPWCYVTGSCEHRDVGAENHTPEEQQIL